MTTRDHDQPAADGADPVLRALIDEAKPQVEALCTQAFGRPGPRIMALSDVNRGRGAFSLVIRVDLDWTSVGPDGVDAADRPATVVAKLPVPGSNGQAARTSGAYRREALAYRQVLPRSPVGRLRCHAVAEDDDGGASFLLEDVGHQRLADQLDGLDDDDALAVARSLADLHRAWDDPDALADLDVRRNTVAVLAPEAIEAGVAALAERWHEVIDAGQRATFADLARAHQGLAEGFQAAPTTLCHGDPRADNLVFDRDDGRPILFDWQQMAVQFGEADLAWLAATSLTVPVRRRIEHELVAAGKGDHDRYRLGLALPGLAVLLLAQRDFPTRRAQRFVAASLQRIAAALADNDTASLAG